MLKEAHQNDELKKKEDEKFLADQKKGAFYKLIPYNKPMYLIYVALFFALLDGLGHPFFGLIFSQVMPLLVAPITEENKEDIIADIKLWSGLVACVGVLMFVSMTGSKWAFGILGENVTFHIRKDLYSSILRKHIGFHDFRENGSSVLTSAMAEDSATINGVSTESLGPQVDGFCGLLVAIVIGFIFSWKVALSCIAIAPFMSIGQYI